MSVSPDFAVYEAKIATMKARWRKAAPANNRILLDALAAVGIAVVEWVSTAAEMKAKQKARPRLSAKMLGLHRRTSRSPLQRSFGQAVF